MYTYIYTYVYLSIYLCLYIYLSDGDGGEGGHVERLDHPRHRKVRHYIGFSNGLQMQTRRG